MKNFRSHLERAAQALVWLRRLGCTLSVCCAAMATLTAQGTGASEVDVDLEIVMAVDASGSVNDEEFVLQLSGIASALRDPRIHRAIRSGPRGKVAAALLIWSDAAFKKHQTGWFILDGPASANHFAGVVEAFRERSTGGTGIYRSGGGTGIGDGVAYGLNMLASNGISGARKVIDVSGDGVETPPWFGQAVELPQARVLAAGAGVTVNGLAILTDFPHLASWYRLNVATGPGSFVIQAEAFSDFHRAMREKLWREMNLVIGARDNGPRVARQ